MLWCIVKEFVVRGKMKRDAAFIGDLETAKETFKNTWAVKDYPMLYLTLYEVDVSGLIFCDFDSIPASRRKEIDHAAYIHGVETINHITEVGRLTADTILKYTTNGAAGGGYDDEVPF